MSKQAIKYGKWETHYFCTECNAWLSFGAVADSHGTCPACGNNNRSTIVDYKVRARRKVYTKPWYKFWEKDRWHWEEKKQEQ